MITITITITWVRMYVCMTNYHYLLLSFGKVGISLLQFYLISRDLAQMGGRMTLDLEVMGSSPA